MSDQVYDPCNDAVDTEFCSRAANAEMAWPDPKAGWQCLALVSCSAYGQEGDTFETCAELEDLRVAVTAANIRCEKYEELNRYGEHGLTLLFVKNEDAAVAKKLLVKLTSDVPNGIYQIRYDGQIHAIKVIDNRVVARHYWEGQPEHLTRQSWLTEDPANLHSVTRQITNGVACLEDHHAASVVVYRVDCGWDS
jgi:hypothetical protein